MQLTKVVAAHHSRSAGLPALPVSTVFWKTSHARGSAFWFYGWTIAETAPSTSTFTASTSTIIIVKRHKLSGTHHHHNGSSPSHYLTNFAGP